jgi:poly(hydroxyalkanoate) granule-associated protein
MAARKKGKGRRASASGKARGAMASAVDAGHHIWLAGLGALARTQHEGPKLFESLVEEGRELEARQRAKAEHVVKGAWKGVRHTVEARAAKMRGKADETLENIESIFQTRVQRALQQLGMPTSHEIAALSRKVNELNRSVQALTRSRSRASRATGSRKPAAAAISPGEGAIV